jgi:hypothetical protein
VEVGGKRAERLDAVGEQIPAVCMGEIGARREVVAVAVAVRDPGDGDEPGSPVGAVSNASIGARPAFVSDPELDALHLLELSVEHECGDEVELVDDDVVARFQIQRE